MAYGVSLSVENFLLTLYLARAFIVTLEDS